MPALRGPSVTIIRSARPERGWTSISNETLRDENLSYRARGLLASILSRPDNWRTNSDALAREGKEGREAVRTALRELVDARYMIVDKVRDEKGQFVTITTVYDTPTTEAQKPVARFPDAGFLGAIEKTEKKDREETPIVPTDSLLHVTEIEDDWDDFWTAYPRKAAKAAARRAWDKAIRGTDPKIIIDAAHRYREDPNRDDAYTAHAATWLNAGRWEDDPLPPRKQSATAMYLDVATPIWDAPDEPLALEG
jgi:hypothetical protein